MPARVVPVTAVLVVHDGGRWLPELLRALAAQTVRPASVLAVDTGSADGSGDLLRTAGLDVLVLPRGTGYAAAVHAALGQADEDHPPLDRFLWLLHDDCAPDPAALEQLLRAAAADPSAGVLGPQVVDWEDPRALVEVGLSVDGAGRTATGVEPGELDQGQHDGQRDVLAVGTAGALVRRETWLTTGGLDPALPLFRDDLDLGWRVRAAGGRVVVVPAARVRHARAATTGCRPVDAAPGGAARVDRTSALHVQIAHAAGWRLVPVLLRLVLGSLVRALVLLLGRRPSEACDEAAALVAVLRRPGRLRAARRVRAATRTRPPSELRPLMVPSTARLRTAAGRVRDRAGRDGAVPGLQPPDAPRPAAWQRALSRPGLLLVAVLGLLALLAQRSLLAGGVLSGGALIPAPPGAAELWSAWAGQQDVPGLALLALLATPLLGSATAAVDLLLLTAVPAAGATAWWAAGRVVERPALRVWAAATWALLPVATGAVAGGRLGPAAVHVGLPALLVLAHRVVGDDPRRCGWHRTWGLGLALTAVAALSPVGWLLAAAALLVCAVSLRGARGTACAVAALVPAVLLLPWADGLPAVLERPVPGLADAALPAWQLLLLSPGGPGTPAVAVLAGLLLAALAGLLPAEGARAAAAGWGLALLGLAGALAVSRTTTGGAAAWPGVPLDLAAAGMLLSALVGARGLLDRLGRSAFGWRQLAAVGVGALAAAAPLLCAAAWAVDGADGPLQRVDRDLLPAHVAAELAADPGGRALLLSTRADGATGYALTGGRGPQLGQDPAAPAGLQAAVTDLLTPDGTSAAGPMAAHGVRVVVLAADDPVARAALDAQPGLAREPGDEPSLYRVLGGGRDAPAPEGARASSVALQVLLVLVVAVLAGPGLPPRRGLLREARP